MGLTDLLFKRQKAQVGTSLPSPTFPLPALVEFDASVAETHNDEVEVTDHPVEDGSDVSDHMRKLPQTVILEGMISNSPLVFLASVQAPSPVIGDFTPTFDRVEAGYAKLREFQEAGVLVDVITSLRSYSNMAILSIAVNRAAPSGNILSFVLTLREVKIAKSLTVDLPTPEDVGNNSAQNAGQKPKKKPTPKQTEKATSTADRIASAIGLFGS